MCERLRRLICLFCLLGHCVGCGRQHAGSQDARVELAPLHCEPGALAIGDVFATSCYPLTLPLCNTASFPVTIESLQTSCGCTMVEGEFEGTVLSPGQQLSVPLRLDLWPNRSGDGSYPFSVVVVADLDRNLKQSWTIEGRVHYAMILASGKDSVALSGEVLHDLNSTIQIRPVISMTDLQASVSIPDCSTTMVSEAGSVRVHVTASARDVPGTETGELIVTGDSADGKRIVLHWPMVVAWEHDLVLKPEIRELGAVPIGVITTQDFQVGSRSAKQIPTLSASVVDLFNCRGDVKTGEGGLRLEIMPIEPGRFSMSFSVNDQSPLPATFSMGGYGYRPNIAGEGEKADAY